MKPQLGEMGTLKLFDIIVSLVDKYLNFGNT